MTDTASAAPSEREQFEAWLPPYWPRETYRDDEGDELFRDSWVQGAWMGWQGRAAQPTPPAVVEPPELSPDFTDTARAALLWVLWHHQGGSSPVGQPIRFALGMGQHDRLNEHQLAEAKRWERLHPANPAVFPRGPEPLTDGLLQQHNRDSQELRRLCAERDQARRERDALKAEIAGLESYCSTLGRLVDELRADSERLEWVLRRVSGTWLRAYLGVVSDTSDMDTLRMLIDANRGALAAHGIKKENGNG